MELAVRNSFKAIGVLIIGYLLGLLSFALYRGEMPFLSAGQSGDKVSLSGAPACTPTTDKDSILFLTCGGIY